MSQARIITGVICLTLIVGLAACNDDDNPVCTGDEAAEPTLENIWPHADGNNWTFDLTYQEFNNPEEGFALGDTSNWPHLPTMATLHAELQGPLPGPQMFATTGMYRLGFDGEIVTAYDVTAQRVSETIYLSLGDQNSQRTIATNDAPQHLLQLISQCRPDLRSSINPLLDTEAKDIDEIRAPMFLGGYAFAFEDTGYFNYGEFDANHSWVYLDSSLEVGAEFDIQLVPALTDDIWLYGKIWSKGSLVVNGQEFENVIEVMYLIDLGIGQIVDEYGNLLGLFRSYLYGTTHYAPEIGPIKGLERHRVTPDSNLNDLYNDVIDYEMNLVGFIRSD